MAERVGQFTISPHGYRILVPYLAAWLARVADIPLPDAFLVLTLFAFAGVNLTLVLWFNRGLGLTLSTALLLSVLYVFSYAGIYNLHNAVHVGYWEHWFLLVGFICIYHGRFWALAAIVLVSVWIKETILLVMPLEFMMVWRARGLRRAILRVSILMGLFLFVFLLLRSGIWLTGTTGFSSYSSFYSLAYLDFIVKGWVQINPIKEIYFAFQLLWLVGLFGWFYAPGRARWMALFVPVAIAQVLLATDTQRMTALAFPAVLLLCAFLLKELSLVAQCFVVALNPLAFLMYNLHGRYLLVFTASAAFWLVFWYGFPLWSRLLPKPAPVARIQSALSGRALLLATALTAAGIFAFLVMDEGRITGSSLGMGLALIGTALGALAMTARGERGFPISARM
jgi:hypothetical protein